MITHENGKKSTENVGSERKRYLLSLFRQDIVTSSEDQIRNNDAAIFVMDYFDRLEVRAISAEEGMPQFVGMDENESFRYRADVTAMQTYSIYRNAERGETDIFTGYEDLPYIGLIHVYVTPDVIAGLDIKDGDCSYILKFGQKIEEQLKAFTGKDMQGRVFQMLSASDFLIVIRSSVPETSYRFSSRIRKLMIGKEDNPLDCLAAFKTYTILGIKRMIYNAGADIKGGIVIRGRYSNHYWKSLASSTLNLPALNLNNEDVKALYGRYDFCIYLTLEEFSQIYQSLRKAKGISDVQSCLPENSSTKVQYLFSLLQGDYLSYINERYYMDLEEAGMNWAQAGTTHSDEVQDYQESSVISNFYLSPDCKTDCFMKNQINEICGKMQKQVETFDADLQGIKDYRKSFVSSVFLLEQLISLCLNANDLSEIRIYVLDLLGQIQVLIDTLKYWNQIYQESEDAEFLNYFDDYFREAVTVMDAYGRNIRNDNFQTLQSPRYHIVPGCSIEKVLTGYSAFLAITMGFCAKELEIKNKEYLPVIIPSLNRSSMWIKVLFPEWVCGTNTGGPGKYLMVVESPATSELVETAYMVATLFHEMAHQLRYESREDRNAVLLEMLLHDIADAAAENIYIELSFDYADEDTVRKLQKALADGIYSVMKERFFKDRQIPFIDESLEGFKYRIQEDMNRFILSLQEQESRVVMKHLKQFIIDSNEYATADDECMVKLVNLWNAAEELENYTEKQDEEKDLIWQKAELKKKLDGYVQYCIDNAYDFDEKKKDDLWSFERSVLAYVSSYMPVKTNRFTGKSDTFYEKLYANMTDWWKTLLEVEGTDRIVMKGMIRNARLLGIDYRMEENKEGFRSLVQKGLRRMDQYSFTSYMRLIDLYREETSDLFMCTMMNLSLVGYLAVCARMDANDKGQYAAGYIERFTDVIIIQWLAEDESWTKDTGDRIMCRAAEKFREIAASVLHNPEYSQISSLGDLQKKLLKENEEWPSEKNNIMTLLLQTLMEITERIKWFDSQEYLYADFQKGKKKYKTLKEKLEHSEEDAIKTICGFCDSSRQYLHELGTMGQNKEQRDYLAASEAFLMKMAAYKKRKNAKEGGIYGDILHRN